MSVEERGEFDNADLADTVATALASQEQAWGDAQASQDPASLPIIRVAQYEGPPPGKVMRCKVALHTRIPAWGANTDDKGQYVGRTIEVPAGNGYSAHRQPDPTDPANVKPDGERLMFGAVCGTFDKDGVSSVEENRIFGYWSPSFSIDGHVRNHAVLANLEQGREYYVDFTPSPKQ